MANSSVKDVCKNIKFYREKLDLTQAKLGEMVDVTEEYISMIERGKRTPTLKRLYMIAEALGVDAYKLLMD